MSLNGISQSFIPNTINGLTDVNSDISIVNTLQVSSLIPNKAIISDSNNFLVSSGASNIELDYLIGTSSNIQTQINSKPSINYVDTNFLNKTTSSNQSVVSKINLLDVLTLDKQAILKEGLKLNSDPTGNWTITAEYIDAYTTNLIFTSSAGAVIKFRGDYGFINSTGWTPSTVPIIDSGGNLITSLITSTELSYLTGLNANLQTQLNYKASTSYVDTNFLNKITATEQTVAGATTFNSTVTANYFFTNNSYNWGRQSASYNAWGIGRVANGTQIRDLQFKDDTAGVTTLLLSNTGQTVYVGLTCDYGTANKVPIWDANKKLVSSGVDSIKISYLDNVSSDVQTQLNGKASTADLALKANLAGGNIFTGAQTINTGSLNIDTRLLGTPDGVSTGNFWIGLRGTGTEVERLAIAIAGPTSTGVVSGVSVAKPLYLTATGITANRAVYLDGDKILKSSAVTSTELLYLSNVTGPIQSQINTIAANQLGYLPLSGGTLTGTVYNNAGDFHAYKGGDTNRGCVLFANNTDGATFANYNGGLASWYGIGFKCTNDSTTRFIFNTRDGNSEQTGKHTCVGVDTTGTVQIGLTSNTATSIKLANSSNHITSVASEAYLFNGVNGYIAIGRNTTRSAIEANLMMGTVGADCSIESIASNGSVYLPLSFYASQYYFSNGNLGIGSNDPKCPLYNYGSGTSGWKGQSYFGNENTGIIAGTYDNKAFLGGHNAALNAWTDIYVAPGGSCCIGNVAPSYKLHVQGDAYATGSLLFGSSGTYTPGCIYSDNAWGCIIRAKTNNPSLAKFLWSDYNDVYQMRISPNGVLNFNGGAGAYAVPVGLSTTPGALVIGGNDTNYNDGWNTGILMECANTTGITIHDAGEKLASFMYYGTDNIFHMGKDAGSGWGATPFIFESDVTTSAFLTVNAGSKIVVQNSVDGGPNRGIWMWNSGDSNWGIYMGQSGYGYSLSAGNPVACAGYQFSQHAIRFRVAGPNTTQGFIFENADGGNGLVASIRSDGLSYFKGNMTIGGDVTGATLNIKNPNGSNTHFGYSDNKNYIRGTTIINSGFFEIGDSYVWRAPLDITTTVSRDNGAVRYFDVYGGLGYTNWYSYSAMADTWGGSRFMAYSDVRKKKDIQTVTNALETVDKIRIVSYKHIDVNQPDNYWGVIAQEVEEEFPALISQGKEFLPNIYQEATTHNCSSCGEYVWLEMKQEMDNALVGKTLKLITYDEGGKQTYDEYTDIVAVKDNRLKVKIWKEKTDSAVVRYEANERVFVYGTCEDDVRTVDKTQFGLLAIASVKELKQQVNVLKQRNQILEEHARAIEERMNNYIRRADELHSNYKLETDAKIEKLASLISQLLKK